MAEKNVDPILKDHQVVLVATDPHLEDLMVENHEAAASSDDLLPAKVIQVPVKVMEDQGVATKMAALIMVEPEDLPRDAQNIITEEIKEVKASDNPKEPPPIVPVTVTSEKTPVIPAFEPYYYVGKLPNNFPRSLTTNVSTNSLSMQKVCVDSTKLTDMLTMARLSTQLSSINDSIHTMIATSEGTKVTRSRGDCTSGIYSSSPCRSSDKPSKRQTSDDSSAPKSEPGEPGAEK